MLKKVRKVAYVDEPLYCYVEYNQSASKGHITESRMTEITAWEYVCDLFQNENSSFLNSCYTRYAMTCENILIQIIRQKIDNEDWLRKLVMAMRMNWMSVMNSSLNVKGKMSIILISLVPKTYVKAIDTFRQYRT